MIEIETRGATAPGVDEAPAANHAAGTEIFAVIAPNEDGGEVTYEATDVVIDESVGPDTKMFHLNTVGRLSAGQTYRIGDELFTIADVVPARVKVERGFDGTEEVSHGRRLPIYAGNSVEVERGFDGTTASAHEAGEDVLLTKIRVEREQEGTKVLDHAKNAEIYLGNSLIVERGVLQTEAAEHESGSPVLDFPPAPDSPPTLAQSCGQFAVSGGPKERPEPIADSTAVDIDLTEWAVDPVPGSIATGLTSLIVHNAGTTQHNLRVILTDLAADGLPIANGAVDESQLDVVAQSSTFAAQTYELVPSTLAPGRYVLICNFPAHYTNGMFTEFEVTQ
jgi:hypothetical protein